MWPYEGCHNMLLLQHARAIWAIYAIHGSWQSIAIYGFHLTLRSQCQRVLRVAQSSPLTSQLMMQMHHHRHHLRMPRPGLHSDPWVWHGEGCFYVRFICLQLFFFPGAPVLLSICSNQAKRRWSTRPDVRSILEIDLCATLLSTTFLSLSPKS